MSIVTKQCLEECGFHGSVSGCETRCSKHIGHQGKHLCHECASFICACIDIKTEDIPLPYVARYKYREFKR